MYQKILVPLDGSELAESVLPHVESIAKGCETKDVIFVNVVKPLQTPVSGPFEFAEEHPAMQPDEVSRERDRFQRGEEKAGAKQADRASAAGNYLSQTEENLKNIISKINCPGINLQAKVLSGENVAETIAEYATVSKTDLIIMATHGRSGISRRVWGSVADKILRSACVPVLMIRPPSCVPNV